ncbi:MAG: zinc-finger-containing protein, partial [Geminicoccaceae bacterium]
MAKEPGPATCLHCGGDCRLTDGAEIYPHRPDLFDKQIWKCDPCAAWVRCHDGSTDPLGYAADLPTRIARIKLHHL